MVGGHPHRYHPQVRAFYLSTAIILANENNNGLQPDLALSPTLQRQCWSDGAPLHRPWHPMRLRDCFCLHGVRQKPTSPRTHYAGKGWRRPFRFRAVPLILRESGSDGPSLQSLDVSLAALLVLCMVSSTSWTRPLSLRLHASPPSIFLGGCHSQHPRPHIKHWPFAPCHLDSLQSRCSKFPGSVSTDRAADNPQAL